MFVNLGIIWILGRYHAECPMPRTWQSTTTPSNSLYTKCSQLMIAVINFRNSCAMTHSNFRRLSGMLYNLGLFSRCQAFGRNIASVYNRSLLLTRLTSTEVSQYQPRWKDRHSPQGEVEVNTAKVRKDSNCFQPIADCLPCRLSTTKKSCVPNCLGFIGRQVVDDEISVIT